MSQKKTELVVRPGLIPFICTKQCPKIFASVKGLANSEMEHAIDNLNTTVDKLINQLRKISDITKMTSNQPRVDIEYCGS